MSDENLPAEESTEDQPVQETKPEAPVVDEKGVPWFNRYKEEQRRARKWEERYAERDRAVQEMQTNFRAQMEALHKNQTTTPQPQWSQTAGVTPEAPTNSQEFNPDTIRNIIREEFGSLNNQRSWQDESDKALSKAQGRYEDLKDPESEFSREVYYETERRLKDFEARGVAAPPTIALDVANEIAASGAVKPRQSEEVRDSVINRADGPPPQSRRSAEAGDEVDIPPDMLKMAKRAGISPEALAKRLKDDPYSSQALRMLKGEG